MAPSRRLAAIWCLSTNGTRAVCHVQFWICAAGAAAGLLDSGEQRLLAALAPADLLRPAPLERIAVHTDLELLQALRSLRCRFGTVFELHSLRVTVPSSTR